MSIIQNKEMLAVTPLRRDALEILEAGLAAVNTEKILRTKINFQNGELCIDDDKFVCEHYERIFFIGIGKCACDGAKVVEGILGEALTAGIVIDVKSNTLDKIKSFKGSHPYPSEKNITATKEIVEMVKDVTEKDLVLVLISGGGSSLLCLPHEMNCADLGLIAEELTKKGADIYELNTVRKHLSLIQGGGLAKMLYPAQVASLIFSDVLGNNLSFIASGPTVLDPTTVDDARKILNKYGIKTRSLIETPKNEKYFERIKNFLVASNRNALVAMKEKAESLGYQTSIETDTLSGNAAAVGREMASKKLNSKECLLFGGETTVVVNNQSGRGGRNQELALSALSHIGADTVLVAAASDGWDNTQNAGAVVDKELLRKAVDDKIDIADYLHRNDSFNFFKKVGGSLGTGRLSSNVSDLFILIHG